MLIVEGNVWDMVEENDAVVIPTNVGYRRDGSAVMGRGLAHQAAWRYPKLQDIYGKLCKERRSQISVCAGRFVSRGGKKHVLVLFPTKPLNSVAPWLSWQNRASIELIEKGLIELHDLGEFVPGRVFLPLLGCGEGGLAPVFVTKVMEHALPESRYVLVKLP